MLHSYRKFLALGIILSLACFAVPAAASEPTPAEALADLNTWRAEAGELPVTEMKPEWNHGCELHDRYMSQVSELTHMEDPSNPAYTPEGAEAGLLSDLAFPEILPSEWEWYVYHRLWLLNPRLSASGYDASDGYACIRVQGAGIEDETRTTPTVTVYPWPPNGGQQVPTTCPGGEMPDPCERDPNGGEAGYPLSLNFNWPIPSHLTGLATVTASSLTASDGSVIPLVTEPESIGVVLIPADPLRPGTTYTGFASGSLAAGRSYPFEISWHFETAHEPPLESERRPKHRHRRRHRHHHHRHHRHSHHRHRHGHQRHHRHV